MAQFALEIPAGFAAGGFVYRRVETGTLESVSCISIPYGFDSYGELWVEVGAMLGGRGNEFITVVFMSGYVASHSRPRWTGTYHVDPYEEIYARFHGVLYRTLRIVGKVYVGDD